MEDCLYIAISRFAITEEIASVQSLHWNYFKVGKIKLAYLYKIAIKKEKLQLQCLRRCIVTQDKT